MFESLSERDGRQLQVASWGAAAFGVDQVQSVEQRAIRLLEEAIEAFQAAKGSPAMAHSMIEYIFARPPGAIFQEIGGVGICLLALSHAAGVSADAEETRELQRILSKPAAHWAARNTNKNNVGFMAADLKKDFKMTPFDKMAKAAQDHAAFVAGLMAAKTTITAAEIAESKVLWTKFLKAVKAVERIKQ